MSTIECIASVYGAGVAVVAWILAGIEDVREKDLVRSCSVVALWPIHLLIAVMIYLRGDKS